MSHVCGILCVAGLLLPCLPQQPEKLQAPKEVIGLATGYYSCTGKDGVGKSYSGVTTIIAIDDVYLVTWAVAGSHTIGIGQRQGDVLSVGWKLGDKIGNTVYKILPGNKLSGHWITLPTDGKSHPERLEFLRPMVKEEI